MNDIDLSKVPEGAQYYSASDDGFYTFYRHIKEVTYEIFYYGGTRWVLHVGTPEEHYTIIPRQDKAWNGEGLPPVGAVCEASCTAVGNELNWSPVSVQYLSRYTAVVRCAGKAGEFIAHPETMKFRPIRTPEQIASDERDKAIKAIVGLIESADSRDMTIAEAIYNSGYRKPC